MYSANEYGDDGHEWQSRWLELSDRDPTVRLPRFVICINGKPMDPTMAMHMSCAAAAAIGSGAYDDHVDVAHHTASSRTSRLALLHTATDTPPNDVRLCHCQYATFYNRDPLTPMQSCAHNYANTHVQRIALPTTSSYTTACSRNLQMQHAHVTYTDHRHHYSDDDDDGVYADEHSHLLAQMRSLRQCEQSHVQSIELQECRWSEEQGGGYGGGGGGGGGNTDHSVEHDVHEQVWRERHTAPPYITQVRSPLVGADGPVLKQSFDVDIDAHSYESYGLGNEITFSVWQLHVGERRWNVIWNSTLPHDFHKYLYSVHNAPVSLRRDHVDGHYGHGEHNDYGEHSDDVYDEYGVHVGGDHANSYFYANDNYGCDCDENDVDHAHDCENEHAYANNNNTGARDGWRRWAHVDDDEQQGTQASVSHLTNTHTSSSSSSSSQQHTVQLRLELDHPFVVEFEARGSNDHTTNHCNNDDSDDGYDFERMKRESCGGIDVSNARLTLTTILFPNPDYYKDVHSAPYNYETQTPAVIVSSDSCSNDVAVSHAQDHNDTTDDVIMHTKSLTMPPFPLNCVDNTNFHVFGSSFRDELLTPYVTQRFSQMTICT